MERNCLVDESVGSGRLVRRHQDARPVQDGTRRRLALLPQGQPGARCVEHTQIEFGERYVEDPEPDDIAPEDVTGTLLDVTGILGLLLVILVVASVTVAMALRRHW